jgi:hypothetical protein
VIPPCLLWKAGVPTDVLRKERSSIPVRRVLMAVCLTGMGMRRTFLRRFPDPLLQFGQWHLASV